MEILSQMWSFLGLLTVLQNVLPTQILSLINSIWESIQDSLSPYSYYEIPEFNGYCGVELNDLYRHVQLYLNSIDASASCRRLTLSLPKNSSRVNLSISPNHTVTDVFNGYHLRWTHQVETASESLEERRSFCLKMPKRDRNRLLPEYLAVIKSEAEEFERTSRDRRLYTNTGCGSHDSGWASIPFRHPSTFETLALEPSLKTYLTSDLNSFSAGKDLYRRVGRAWKRGYLLYGPPGSGKSSLIAAMANHLHYDVYDLELTKVCDNSELRALLIQTTNRSIIVIEDIDCSLDLTADRKTKWTAPNLQRSSREGDDGRVTLSGILNFTDGLWSCCGEERIIVFTTNHRDTVDPALLRHGRMDVHIRLGKCGFQAFKQLAKNYLGIESHVLFNIAEKCIRSGGELTPAEIGEIMLRNRTDSNLAIREVVMALQRSTVKRNNSIGCGGVADNFTGFDSEETEEEKRETEMSDFWAEMSPESLGGKRRKMVSSWEKRVKFLVRLKGLSKSDSGRRGA